MIYYRISAHLSPNQPPIFKGDKFRLAKMALKSFVGAFSDIKPQMYVLFDNCGKDYLEMFKKECPFDFKYEFTTYGNYNSCLKQYLLADKNKDEMFLFIEDDYLWRKGAGKYMISAIKELGIVTPYDNPDFYISEPYKSRKEMETLIIIGHTLLELEKIP